MQMTEQLDPVLLLVPPAAVTAAMWAAASNSVSLTALGAAYAILQWAWGSYLHWHRQNRRSLPIFAIIASVYWIFFALPLFWGERVMLVGHYIPLGEDYMTQGVLMAFVGVGCLWAGMQLPLEATSTQNLPDIDQRTSSSWVYLRMVLVITSAMGMSSSLTGMFGAGGRNAMVVLTSTVPSAAFLLLLQRCWMGTASPIDKPLLITVAAARVVGFLASGWLSPTIGLGLTVVAFYIVIRRSIPWTPILLTLVALLFLQAGKQAYRGMFWGADADATASVVDRAKFWFNTSVSLWSDALLSTEGGETTSGQLASRTMQRASLLGQVAHVIELTPSQVPFQGGQTYTYLAVALIPRFVWPDKPSMNQANQFYQVAYGLTDARSLDKVSIAVGSMAEGYINFGWLGVALVMFGIGAILRLYESLCTTAHSNSLLLALCISILPGFLSIESQLGVYLGGLLQNILLAFLIFLPITRRKSSMVLSPSGFEASMVQLRR